MGLLVDIGLLDIVDIIGECVRVAVDAVDIILDDGHLVIQIRYEGVLLVLFVVNLVDLRLVISVLIMIDVVDLLL